MWKLILSAAVTAALLILLGFPLSVGNFRIPAIGEFFNPETGFWVLAEPLDCKPKNQTLFFNGLSDKVTVVYDRRAVPHIFASSEADAIFAQGFVTARERLWQMDISTRATAGRLSEILGERTLEYDRMQRQRGLPFAAENAVRGWRKFPESYALLEAYSKGVNAYIGGLKKRDWPIEFKLLDYGPEPWTVYHTALFTKSMAYRLCSAERDLESTVMLQLLGDSLFHALYPEWNPQQVPVIPPQKTWPFKPISVRDSIETAQIPAPLFGMTDTMVLQRPEILLGSNNWAISGQRTASGRPVLCNDPHLGLSLPSVWYEIEIHLPDHHTHGVSLPGLPGIFIGFNQDIAWGVTNAGHDVLDWYKVAWANEERTQYLIDDQVKAVDIRIEEIHLRAGESIRDSIKYCTWGPIFEEGPHAGFAMRWLGHDEPFQPEIKTFLDLVKARNTTDVIHATGHFIAPAQNFVFADRFGNIGLRISGHLPLKRPLQGRFLQDGQSAGHAWSGFIPQRHNPLIVNPEQGFIFSANQQSTDPSYPYYYNGVPYFEDYRSRTIQQMLDTLQAVKPEDMMRMQYDQSSCKASDILPLLLKTVAPANLEGAGREVYATLAQWDYTYRSDAIAPVYFEILFEKFYRLTWDEIEILRDSLPVQAPEAWMTIALAKDQPHHPWFDIDSTTYRETFMDIGRMAFEAVSDQIGKRDKPYPAWGAFQRTTIRHMAGLDAFSRSLENAPGHGDAINATTPTNGPSWRMIVALGDHPRAWVIYPGGQSGNPGSGYYDNQIEQWIEGEYHAISLYESIGQLKANDDVTCITNLHPK